MYYKNPNIVLRKILPSYFLIDITKCYNNNTEKMFITDEIGAEIWQKISDGDEFETLFNKFILKITDEKTPELLSTIKKDLEEYIELLIKENFIYMEKKDGI